MFCPSQCYSDSEDISEKEDLRFLRLIGEERTFLVYEKNLYELLAHCQDVEVQPMGH